MLKRLMRVIATMGAPLGGAILAIALLFFTLGDQVAAGAAPTAQSYADHRQTVTPIVLQVDPNRAPNNLDTGITIVGSGYQAEMSGTLVMTPPRVSLNDLVLTSVSWVNSSTLTATIPWGLAPGPYTVTVTNPDGRAGRLTDAFSVEEGLGVWTTGGPYGGYIEQILVNPQVTTTIYAIGTQVGLFKSTDGGEWWDRAITASVHVGAMALKPNAPQTLAWGDDKGLYESPDEGLTWRKLITGHVSAVAYAPSSPETLYALHDGSVRVSSNGGQSWEPSGSSLPHLDGRALAVHPVTATIAYVGTYDGAIFKTIDGGASWDALDTSTIPDDGIFRLLIDPFSPNRVYALGGMGSRGLHHRSVDGGAHWEQITCDPACSIIDLAFHPTISGTVYGLSLWDLYLSTNGGEQWSQILGGMPEPMMDLEVDPVSGVPLYTGGNARGVFRSDDGGQTWQEKSQGLSALQPLVLAAVPGVPEQVYATADTAGAFRSQNAGQDWRSVEIRERIAIQAVATQPDQPCVAYLGGFGPALVPDAGVGFVYRTVDCGSNWEEVSLADPHNLGITVRALAADPHHTNTVYAGVSQHLSGTMTQVGKLYRSHNQGTSWVELDLGYPISVVKTIVADPMVTDTLYLATGEDAKNQGGRFPADFPAGHIYRSLDGGDSWEATDTGLSGLPIAAMVVDPVDTAILYAAIYERDGTTEAGGVFKSTDRGETWHRYSTGLPTHNITSLGIDPLKPERLFVGTWSNGLYVSENGAASWQPFEGPLSQNITILCLATSSRADRTFLYVGIAGGTTTSGGDTRLAIRSVHEETVLSAGVYQQTIISRPLNNKTYLPLVVRRR